MDSSDDVLGGYILLICWLHYWDDSRYAEKSHKTKTTSDQELGQPSFNLYMGLTTNPNTQALIGTATGLFYAGGFIGVILNAYVADRFGRKVAVAVGSSTLLVATACLAGSVNIAMFIVFRFFVGVGYVIGSFYGFSANTFARAYMLYLTVPLWVTELVPPKGRSILAGIVGLCAVVGYIVAAYVGVGFYYYQTTSSSQWRAPIAIGCFPTLVMLASLKFLPESPRWLLDHHQPEKALKIVKDFHTRHDDNEHVYALAEFEQMRINHELESTKESSWLSILRRPSYRKRAMIAFLLPCILYSTGNLVITSKQKLKLSEYGMLTLVQAYAASIFAGIGFNAGESLNMLAGSYVASIVGNLISLTYVDRIPRHIILSVGVVAVTVVLTIHTAMVATYLGQTGSAGLSTAAAFIFLFLFTFNLFLEGPSLYYTSEIFPTHLRAKGMAINVGGFCLINILWLELAPTAIGNIGWKYFLVFICVSLPGAAFIFFQFPDTLRKPLEEVALLFGDEDLITTQDAFTKAQEGKQGSFQLEEAA